MMPMSIRAPQCRVYSNVDAARPLAAALPRSIAHSLTLSREAEAQVAPRLTPASAQTIRSVWPSNSAGVFLGAGIGRPRASVTPLLCRNWAHLGSTNSPLRCQRGLCCQYVYRLMAVRWNDTVQRVSVER
jgi:hypothetical protein